MHNWQVGDKVELPIKKSIGCSWEKCEILRAAITVGQNYLFIVKQIDNGREVELGLTSEWSLGEFFGRDDLKLWTTGSPDANQIRESRKIYKQIYGQETI
jgi:hypothetical protein